MMRLRPVVLALALFLAASLWLSAAEIHDAVRSGDVAKVRAILDKDAAAANALDEESGRPPLILACFPATNMDMVRCLVERGADVNFVRNYAGTLLDIVFENTDGAAIPYLQSKGAKFSPIDLRTAPVRGTVSRITFAWGMLNNIAVSAGPDGVLIVDSGFSKRATDDLKKILAGLGTGELKVIVNSHPHGDHTAGNILAGPGVKVINAQELRRPEAVGARPLSTPLKGPGGAVLEGLVGLPFNGEDVVFIPYPGLHSPDDVMTYFRGSGVVHMGDLLLSQSCPALSNVAGYMGFLDKVIDIFPAETIFVSGHGRDLTMDGLKKYRSDLQAMIDIVRKECGRGRTAEDMIKDDILKAYKDEYSQLDWLGPDSWLRRVYNELKSAAVQVERVMAASGIDRAKARFEEIRTAGAGGFAIVEREFNALGYRLLQARKPEQARAVFEMNITAFPDSWNAWDSLGEGHFAIGELDPAEKAYVRSLELNPRNTNAERFLSHIRGTKINAQRETKVEARFKPGEKTGLQGPYLGQKPPGLKPELFAPGIISTAGHFDFAITFSPDGRELHFTSRPEPDGQNAIWVSRWEKDGWTAPEVASFSAGGWSNEPFITPDGKKVYFGSQRSLPGATEPSYGIWVSDRTAGGWGAPRYHGPGMFVSCDRAGNLYLTDITRVAGGGIVRYPWIQGAFGKPERLGGGVNQPVEADHAFIAPDGSFIVFDASRPGGQGGEGDLYVCFRQADGTWGDAFNLGDAVNTDATNFCPSLSPDGKYLFFGMNRDIYWVSAEVIERLRPKAGTR